MVEILLRKELKYKGNGEKKASQQLAVAPEAFTLWGSQKREEDLREAEITAQPPPTWEVRKRRESQAGLGMNTRHGNRK